MSTVRRVIQKFRQTRITGDAKHLSEPKITEISRSNVSIEAVGESVGENPETLALWTRIATFKWLSTAYIH